MVHTARKIAPLLRSLLLGSAFVATAAVSTTTLVACANEDDPATHVKRLEDPAQAPAAVKRLIQFFEDAMTRDKKDLAGPTVKPLLDTIVEPMTKLCQGDSLNERTKSSLVKFLSDARDPRAIPCFKKVLDDYKPNTNEEDVRWVARAATHMKAKELADSMLKVFTTIKVAEPKAATIYRDVNDAVLELANPSYEATAISLLEKPLDKSTADMKTVKNEVFWQITAAQILGNLKSEKAIKPLIKVVLSPSKADLAATAVIALIKIGKPAIGPATELLNGTDKDLVEYSKTENLVGAQKGTDGKIPEASIKAAEKAHIATAAIILATIGREDAAPPLLAAIEKTTDNTTKAILARELTKLPRTAQTVEVFKGTFEKVPMDTMIPPGSGAKESLLEASTSFFDSSLVSWMVKLGNDAKGEAQDVDAVRGTTLLSAAKLAKPDQIGELDSLAAQRTAPGADGKASTVGKAYEKELKMTKELLAACKENIDCYVGKIAEGDNQEKERQFVGIKAAYMIGVLGGPEVKDKIVAVLPKVRNAAVRFVTLSVLDFHSPKGDVALADKLQKMLDDAVDKKDQEMVTANSPLSQFIPRLRARAQ
jgi:hypothetical protein